MEFSLGQVAEILEGELIGNATDKVHNLAKIEEGVPGTICFLSNPDYTEYIYTTKATAVIVGKDFTPEKALEHNPALIKVEDPRMAFTKVLGAYQAMREAKLQGIHPSAVIDESAIIGENVYIGPLTTVGANAVIEDGAKIHSQCYIGPDTKIGKGTLLHNRVSIHEYCQIGAKCIFQSGAIIGGDGFGFQPNSENNYTKVPHIGNVIVEDHVEIGANTTVDRATMGSTIIKRGVKLDNLIQIGHNVEIGENTVIAAQTGIAGSTKIGKNCMMGGQVGIVGHITIADETKIAAKSGIAKSITDVNTIVQGAPSMSIGDFKKSYILFKKLPDMNRKMAQLEKQINSIDNN